MGGSNLLDGRPAPVSKIADWSECVLLVTCRPCRRVVRLPLGLTAQQHRLPPSARVYELAERLVCRDCGGKGTALGLEGWARG